MCHCQLHTRPGKIMQHITRCKPYCALPGGCLFWWPSNDSWILKYMHKTQSKVAKKCEILLSLHTHPICFYIFWSLESCYFFISSAPPPLVHTVQQKRVTEKTYYWNHGCKNFDFLIPTKLKKILKFILHNKTALILLWYLGHVRFCLTEQYI